MDGLPGMAYATYAVLPWQVLPSTNLAKPSENRCRPTEWCKKVMPLFNFAMTSVNVSDFNRYLHCYNKKCMRHRGLKVQELL